MALKFYKFKDKRVFIQEIKRFGEYKNFALASDLTADQISVYVRLDKMVEYKNAIKIANALRIDFDELFELAKIKKDSYSKANNPNVKDESDLQISEKILVGLKANIKKQLEVSHDISYTNNILSLIDDIIIEATYLGYHQTRDNNEQFILKAIKKRRLGK